MLKAAILALNRLGLLLYFIKAMHLLPMSLWSKKANIWNPSEHSEVNEVDARNASAPAPSSQILVSLRSDISVSSLSLKEEKLDVIPRHLSWLLESTDKREWKDLFLCVSKTNKRYSRPWLIKQERVDVLQAGVQISRASTLSSVTLFGYRYPCLKVQNIEPATPTKMPQSSTFQKCMFWEASQNLVLFL